MRGFHVLIALNTKSSSRATESSEFVPRSIFQSLPAQTPKPTSRQNATYNPKNKDYRLGPIRIDWADFEMSNSTPINIGKGRQDRGPAVATFVSKANIKSGSTNLPTGTVHVFRDASRVPADTEDIPSPSLPESSSDGITLGVLAVPSWMNPSDFLTFVAPAADGISHLRIIRDSAPNRSMVLIKFPKTEEAVEFAEAYNGKPFNSMEPEICHVVHILSVTIDTDDTASPTITRMKSSHESSYELPTCPVCLERMDSAVTGLITVPCSHTFHCLCLSKWGDSRCPVCRYSQTLRTSHPTSSSSSRSTVPIPFSAPSSETLASCSTCSSTTNLWICLICGTIGCGRYGRAHAYAHYEQTTHLYALELETQRVWDYAGDGYVHRLIQNKSDGKLVELPSAASSMGATARDGGVGPSPADALSAEKIEAIGIEYSYLLTSQLDSQRSYYEEQCAELKAQVESLQSLMERVSRDFERDTSNALLERQERDKEERQRLQSLEKEKAKAESRADKMTELARRLDKELREERAVTDGMLKNLAKLKEKADDADKKKLEISDKVRELEDQLKDVMFFLEARTKIENGDGVEAEAAGGTLEVKHKPKKARR